MQIIGFALRVATHVVELENNARQGMGMVLLLGCSGGLL